MININYISVNDYIETILESDVIQNQLYNSSFLEINKTTKQDLKPFNNNICFKFVLSDREKTISFNGDYICNHGEFKPSKISLLPAKTKKYSVMLLNEKLGYLEIINYPVTSVSINAVLLLLFYIVSIFFDRNKKPSSSDNVSELINNKVFLKNKRLFPIRNDIFIYARYKDNSCDIFLKGNKKITLRCSLDALRLICFESKKIKRNILVSSNCEICPIDKNTYVVTYEGESYEI
ncbi:hypothetical protein [Photobacterium damselae]|uniref:hypothetical protein n=1 Tax=Photobacterium damselae TaxID=38293 RepID=UPI0010FEF688|nr:hypothetical protein [Photobacterium damselae]TLS72231.1 hypothetical protein FD718_03035 [Photobacterium damselae subsp. damselae]